MVIPGLAVAVGTMLVLAGPALRVQERIATVVETERDVLVATEVIQPIAKYAITTLWMGGKHLEINAYYGDVRVFYL